MCPARRIYHWQERRSINRFSNVTVSDERFQARPKITSLKFINDDDMALLLTGTGAFGHNGYAQ